MANIKVLDNDLLAQLWTKCMNTFAQRPGLDPQVAMGNLYHLGAYDSYVDNNDGTVTITRQTGYIDWVYLATRSVQPGGTGNYYYFVIDDSIYYDLQVNYEFINSYGLTNSAFSPVNSGTINNALAFSTSGTNDSRLCIRKTDSITSVETLKSWTQANKLLVQFKLATPYTEKVIKNRPLNTLNASGSAWIQNEYDKTKNIWDETWRNGYYSTDGAYNSYAGVICSTDYIEVNPNTSYYFSNDKLGRICYYNSSKTFISYEDYNQCFTTPSNCAYIRFDMITEYGATYNNDIVISKEGAITHKKDITPVLLWENGNPTSDFASGNMSANTSGYSYLVIAFKPDKMPATGVNYQKFKNEVGKICYISVAEAGDATTYRRSFTITDTTKITAGSGYIDASVNNAAIIPIAIYGTNIL